MISISDHETIYVWSEPVDMRRGFNGLSAMVIESDLNLFDGGLFVFISKNRDRIKILTWTRAGLALWYKKIFRLYLYDLYMLFIIDSYIFKQKNTRSPPSFGTSQQKHISV